MADILLAFKAGRAFRREGSSIVEPSATKGAIILKNGDDGLLHFMWKNRVTNDVEEDLILFPADATFHKVGQSSGRVYVLKFSSSNQRHFFWMQDASSERDEEFARNLNTLLQDANETLEWSSAGASTSQPQASGSTQTSESQAAFQATPEQLAQLQAALASITGTAAGASSHPEMSLIDILTPANITPLFTSHPELIPTLFPHLPPDLPVPPSEDALRRIINSPQFRAAVSNFDQALRTGLLGNMVRSLGLPEEAGTGIGPFLRAVQEQADRGRDSSSDDRIETD